MNRTLALTVAMLAVIAPVLSAVPAAAYDGATPAQFSTGRPVDSIALHRSGDSLSISVSDEDPEGTTLTINREWLRETLGKGIEYTRFYRNGELIDSYKLTENYIVVDIPHFSTQTVTAQVVDKQYTTTGSASGKSTQTTINYNVNEGEIQNAVLEIHGSGSKEGSKVVDQFPGETDSQEFTWTATEIPRNITLKTIGRGTQTGQSFNESVFNTKDGDSNTIDLSYKPYNANITVIGNGTENGSLLEKGPFKNFADGDTINLTFGKEQSNESIIFIGNTTSRNVTGYESESFNSFNDTNAANVTVKNGNLTLGRSGWKTSKLSYNSNNFNNSNVNYYQWGHTFSWGNGGTNLYVINSSSDTMYQHSVTEAYNISSVQTPAEETKSVAPGPTGLYWKSDGTKFFITTDGDTIYEYNVSTTWNISSSSTGRSKTILNPNGVEFNPDGTEFYTTLGDHINKYTMSNTWDVSSATKDKEIFFTIPEPSGEVINDGSIEFGDSGKKFYFTDPGDSQNYSLYYEYDLPEAYNVTALNDPANHVRTGNTSDIEAGPNWGIEFSSDGSNMYILSNGTVYEYEGPPNASAQSGYWERKYTTPLDVTHAKLNWTDYESGGTVKWYIKTDGNSYTEVTSSENVEQDLTDGKNLWVRANLSNTTSDPEVDKYEIEWDEHSDSVKSEDGSIDIDDDGVNEGSFSGKLNEGETRLINLTGDIEDGEVTFSTTGGNNSAFDWKYEGNNDNRTHVKNVSINGVDYTIGKHLGDGTSHTVDVTNASVVLGQNSIVYNDYGDTETATATRLDVRGFYENRSIVDNVTINGNEKNLDANLAKGEVHTIDITSDSNYGDNTIEVGLKENTTQNQVDINVTWYKENRTIFTNVTINGTKYKGNDEYSGVASIADFLASGETLTLDIQGSLSPGNNDHTFKMLTSRTEMNSLDYTEKFDSTTNVSATLKEKHGSYNKSLTKNFTDVDDNGTTFIFGRESRVMRVESVTVKNTSTTGIANTTELKSDEVRVNVTDKIDNKTTYTVIADMRKYNVSNADDTLRSENDVGNPYKVDVGISTVTNAVEYMTREKDLTEDEWEILLTTSGTVHNETTGKVTFAGGNVTIPQGFFGGSGDGFVVQRPEYSNSTYTGTVNVIHPSSVMEPGHSVVHQTPLYSDSSTTFTEQSNYSVTGIDSPLKVEWKDAEGSHVKWTTNNSGTYTQKFTSTDTDNVQVLADGETHGDFNKTGDTVYIDVSGDTTWDLYKYEKPTVEFGSSNIAQGKTKVVTVTVKNPNSFGLTDVELQSSSDWVDEVSPSKQNIDADGEATYDVTITVPQNPETSTVEFNVSSLETGDVDTNDLSVSAGGVIGTDTGISNSMLLGGAALLLLLMMAYFATKSGGSGIQDEIDELID